MSGLLWVELTRLRWRRAVLVLLVVAAALPLLVLGMTAWNSRPVSAEELRQAEQLAAEEAERGEIRREIRRCERDPMAYGVPDELRCEEMLLPQPEWYIYREPLDVDQVLRNEALAVVVLATGLLMLAATTYVGADWSSGSLSNQLLFESRRRRIWWAKAGAASLLGAVTMALLLGIFWGGVALLVRSRGVPVAEGVVGDVWAFSGRAALLCAAACLGAYALTMLFRSTVFTLGALFAVTILSVMAFAVLAFSEQWLPHLNVTAVLYDGVDYYRQLPSSCFERTPPSGVDCTETARVELGSGAVYLGVALATAVVASLGSFLRRDVP